MVPELRGNTAEALTSLPTKLLARIVSYLPNRDIKSLRLTSQLLHEFAHLRIERVFLSADQRNLDVFRAVADHEVYRRHIKKIIWDDTRLLLPPQFSVLDCGRNLREQGPCAGAELWYINACRENIADLRRYQTDYTGLADCIERAEQDVASTVWLKESFALYDRLSRKQEENIRTNADVEAFEYGLKQFPALKRVTVTPVIHARIFHPLYQTPMIRTFPTGFNYPVPCGWPTHKENQPAISLWTDLHEHWKDRWRGVQGALHVLARDREHHNISELVFDVNQLNTGINCTIFEQPCEELFNFLFILKQPGFKRLDLAIICSNQCERGWPIFSNGNLRDVLRVAVDLEHFSFKANVSALQRNSSSDIHFSNIRLDTVFPVANWQKLRHFGLSGLSVHTTGMVRLLDRLPLITSSVELSFLSFSEPDVDNWSILIEGIRNRTRWRYRSTSKRPKLVVGVDVVWNRRPGLGTWIEKEVYEFLYGNGLNPFDEHGIVRPGVGIERDSFNPDYERPHVHPEC
ncbi:uncharacterized protein BO88DRAFT_328179 [Aspergillus vadensis CBS 113365]|uniref:F-box domain-containing protein n=1 Tax=Aspergillus vadensis (strain CBS 113365 / IMI 142717 / IBT 24658) TaxID=1448311 RepID=A0A319BLT6_ASPVC|nr:hypothetical protein BO88DRAFT_328179 [Aspergillus vadensis CBS 113365]PYH74256.1 hypothetical protein BO88DRAFT_328179 [Aspergillus vadensis CBS 113365]